MTNDQFFLKYKNIIGPVIQFFWRIPRNFVILFIHFYQKTLSPDHSPWMKGLFPFGHCKFRPTCSEYAKEAFRKKGFVIGLCKTIWRLIRCNPWGKGGEDPLRNEGESLRSLI